MAKTVVALYDSFNDAQAALQDLLNSGFRRDDISLVANDEKGKYSAATNTGASAAGGGAGIGAALGGVTGLLVGLGALAIPGIGPVLAAGPLVAALAGAGIGAVAGGLIGALVEAGVPEEEARYYAEGVRHGGTLVTVRASDDMVDRATQLLNHYHPVDIHQRATQWQSAGNAGFERGVSQPQAPAAGTADQPGRAFSTYQTDFRRNYEQSYATAGYSYDQFEPAYRYGYELGHNQSYRGRDWKDLESEARRAWELNHPNSSWQDYSGAVRFGWERASGVAGDDMPAGTERFQAAGPDWQADTGTAPRDWEHTTSDATAGAWNPADYGTRRDVERTQPGDVSSAEDRPSYPGETTANTPDWKQNSLNAPDIAANRPWNQGPQASGDQPPAADQGGFTAARSTGRVQGMTQGPAGDYDYDTGYHRHYETNYANSGFDYERYRPAYDYGRALRNDRRFSGRDWNDFESMARADWEQRYPDRPWDNVKDAVRYAWTGAGRQDQGPVDQG